MIRIETPKGTYEVDTDDRELAISHVRKHMGLDMSKFQKPANNMYADASDTVNDASSFAEQRGIQNLKGTSAITGKSQEEPLVSHEQGTEGLLPKIGKAIKQLPSDFKKAGDEYVSSFQRPDGLFDPTAITKEVIGNLSPASPAPVLGSLKVKGYHGGRTVIESFDKKMISSNTGEGWLGKGFYFSPHADVAPSYGPITTEAEITLKNPFYFPDDVNPIKFVKEMGGSEKFTEWVKSKGHDGIVSESLLHQIIAFEPEQIKTLKK